MKSKKTTLFRIPAYFTICLFWALSVAAESAPQRDIRMLSAGNAKQDNHRFYIELVEEALDVKHHQSPYKLNLVPADGYYTYHKIQMVNREIVDITVFGANSDPANKAREIAIPVTAGLLGNRVALVHKDKLTQYNSIRTTEQLKDWVACLGKDWKDADIFEHNGLTVNRLSEYKLMLKALQRGRCDYFPRAIHEGFVEAQNIKESFPDIRLADQLIIQYPFATHYYVRHDDKQLYTDLYNGLLRMTKSGKLQSFIQDHFHARHVFPLSKWQEHHFIQLQNPLFDKSIYEEGLYWIEINQSL